MKNEMGLLEYGQHFPTAAFLLGMVFIVMGALFLIFGSTMVVCSILFIHQS